MHLYKEGLLPSHARQDVLSEIRDAQDRAMEDDWRIGAIEQYLRDQKCKPNSTVSVIELWHRALGEAEESKPARKDSIEITQIMANMPGWVPCKSFISTPWGRQRGFRKDNLASFLR